MLLSNSQKQMHEYFSNFLKLYHGIQSMKPKYQVRVFTTKTGVDIDPSQT